MSFEKEVDQLNCSVTRRAWPNNAELPATCKNLFASVVAITEVVRRV
jgi:hypothetical protein